MYSTGKAKAAGRGRALEWAKSNRRFDIMVVLRELFRTMDRLQGFGVGR